MNYIQRYEGSPDWDAMEFLPRFTQLMINEYSFKLFCYQVSKSGIASVRELYNEWTIYEVYDWYYISLASDYRPPNMRG